MRGELTFAPTYNDDFVGWPLRPKDRTHGVYGTFLNPTTRWPAGMGPPTTGYHKAIDILVNDAAGPQPVFAVEGGRVGEAKHAVQITPLKERVQCGVVGVGHFRYAHVVPEVRVGDRVDPGQRIGHTCPGWWHLHLEEWATKSGRRTLLNPLRPGGKLAPVVDGKPPFVSELRIYAQADENKPSPTPLRLDRIRGVVVPVALAMDEFPFREWPKAPRVPLHVYRASIEVRRREIVVLQRNLFQLDTAPGPTWQHFFRPLTRRSAPIAVCIVRKPANCAGRFWLRLWERGWDTRALPNDRYELALTVEDTAKRRAQRTIGFRIAN